MKKLFATVFTILFLISCSKHEKFDIGSRNDFKTVNEETVFEIKLTGELSEPDAEISGLAWYKNNLILLPQFPYKFGNGLYGSIYYLPKEKIKRTIVAKSQLPLTPQKIQIDVTGLDYFNWWGSGYEGVIFNGDDVYFVLENYKDDTEGFVVSGKIDFLSKKIKLNPNSLAKIDIQVRLPNLSSETITVFNDEIYTINEINGINLNPTPTASKFSKDLKSQTHINFPIIEYRITDATKVEADSTFWAINYLWTGDIGKLKPGNDALFSEYGVGQSQVENYSVERLVKFKIAPDGIRLVPIALIYMKLEGNKGSRNWEGIAKLDDLGFLLATDKFPKTILGFVQNPN